MGNGGFSVRSKKLQQILATDPIINPAHDVNEDHYICRIMGRYLRDKHGIRFAPESIAKLFSCESIEYDGSALGLHGQEAFFEYILAQHKTITKNVV